MKVVHLFKIYWPDNGGGIASAIDMAAYAFNQIEKSSHSKKNKFEQEIVVCRPYPKMPAKKDTYNGINVYRCESVADIASTPISIQLLKTAKKLTKNADIVMYHFPYPMIDLGILFGLFRGKLVVCWHCDFETQKGKLLTNLYMPLVKYTLKKADAIIVGAKGTVKGSKALRKYRDKCVVIPYSVSDALVAEGKQYFSHKKDEKREKIHVLFLGRFVWYKGIDLLIKAFHALDQEKYELTLVGGGPLFDDMKILAESLNLKNVLFTGSVSEKEKKQWIQWSDFLVLPSTSKAESFAIVQIEAMAFGKPVINTWIPSGVPDVSVDGKSGITVEPGNIGQLTDAMKKIGENDELRRKFSANAIKLVEKRYTMTKLTERYQTLFDSLNIG